MFAWFKALASAFLDAFYAAMAFLVDELVGGFIRLAISVAQYFIDLLPDFMDDVQLQDKVDQFWSLPGIEFALYLFPIQECFVIWSILIGPAVFIRTARHVIGWIPGMDG